MTHNLWLLNYSVVFFCENFIFLIFVLNFDLISCYHQNYINYKRFVCFHFFNIRDTDRSVKTKNLKLNESYRMVQTIYSIYRIWITDINRRKALYYIIYSFRPVSRKVGVTYLNNIRLHSNNFHEIFFIFLSSKPKINLSLLFREFVFLN